MIYLHGPAHEDTSWRFSVFARRKLQLKSRDPIGVIGLRDLSINEQKVNAANKNKTGMVGQRASGRMNTSLTQRSRKYCC